MLIFRLQIEFVYDTYLPFQIIWLTRTSAIRNISEVHLTWLRRTVDLTWNTLQSLGTQESAWCATTTCITQKVLQVTAFSAIEGQQAKCLVIRTPFSEQINGHISAFRPVEKLFVGAFLAFRNTVHYKRTESFVEVCTLYVEKGEQAVCNFRLTWVATLIRRDTAKGKRAEVSAIFTSLSLHWIFVLYQGIIGGKVGRRTYHVANHVQEPMFLKQGCILHNFNTSFFVVSAAALICFDTAKRRKLRLLLIWLTTVD